MRLRDGVSLPVRRPTVASDGIGTPSAVGIVQRPTVSAVCLSPSVYRLPSPSYRLPPTVARIDVSGRRLPLAAVYRRR